MRQDHACRAHDGRHDESSQPLPKLPGPCSTAGTRGKLAGSGTIVWESRQLLAAGKIDYDEFMDRSCASVPSLGHCNTMGTALSMNSLAEALGMTLPGSAAIPAPYRERGQMAYECGLRIVAMVRENLTPDKVMTREAIENAIVVNSAIGGSTNCPVHIVAIAKHMGVAHDIQDWQTHGYDVPLLVNCMPAGHWLGEAFHRAGGVPAVLGELLRAGRIHSDCLTVNGRTIGENCAAVRASTPTSSALSTSRLREKSGFLVLTGNLFDSAVIKTSVIGDRFRSITSAQPGSENRFEGRAIVFEGPEDYHARIDDPSLKMDADCFLVMRGCGSIGYPGAPEVVNMTPPGLPGEAGHHRASVHRRRTPERHQCQSQRTERHTRIRCRQQSRPSANGRPHRHRPQHLPRGRTRERRGVHEASRHVETRHACEPDTMAGTAPQVRRPALRGHVP